MPYFDEPVGRVKIQTTSKNSQRYYTTKRLIRDLLSNTNFMSVRKNFADIYLRGMRDRRMRSGTELAREIQLTDWSTARNRSNRSSGVQIPRDICTRFGRYLYSTKCSRIINSNIPESVSSHRKSRSTRRHQLCTNSYMLMLYLLTTLLPENHSSMESAPLRSHVKRHIKLL